MDARRSDTGMGAGEVRGVVVPFPRAGKWLSAVVRDLRPADVGGLAPYVILTRMVSRADGHDRGFFESVASMSDGLGYSPRHVKRALGKLRGAGLIRARIEQGRSGPKAPTYDVDEPAIRALAERCARAAVERRRGRFQEVEIYPPSDELEGGCRVQNVTPRGDMDVTPRGDMGVTHKYQEKTQGKNPPSPQAGTRHPGGCDRRSVEAGRDAVAERRSDPPRDAPRHVSADAPDAINPLDPGVAAKARAFLALWPSAALDREDPKRVRLAFVLSVVRDGRDPDRIVAAARRYLTGNGYTGERGRYAKRATEWLAWRAEQAVDPEPPASVAEDWVGHLRRWSEFGIWNSARLGPLPTSPDCRAPADLVAEAVAHRRGPSR